MIPALIWSFYTFHIESRRRHIIPTMEKPHGEGFLKQRRPWWTAVFRDIQFWVPFIVLLIGLLLLGIAR